MLDSPMSFEEVNKFRVAIGLRPIVKRKTTCLGCGHIFESKDYPRQRLCRYCRYDTDDFLSYTVPLGQDLMTG